MTECRSATGSCAVPLLLQVLCIRVGPQCFPTTRICSSCRIRRNSLHSEQFSRVFQFVNLEVAPPRLGHTYASSISGIELELTRALCLIHHLIDCQFQNNDLFVGPPLLVGGCHWQHQATFSGISGDCSLSLMSLAVTDQAIVTCFDPQSKEAALPALW